MLYPLTLTATTTWFGIVLVINGPSWFVSTMTFFYWIFPSLLPRLQRYSKSAKQISIHIHFWLNIIIGVGLFFIFYSVIPDVIDPFDLATFWPVSRLPVFIMGLLGGLLRAEYGSNSLSNCLRGKTVEQWQRRATWLGIWICVLFLVCGFIENLYHVGMALWLQFVIAWWFLEFIWSLTCDDGQSIWYWLFTTKLALYLGKISYALYLIHEVIIWYIMWIVYGYNPRPDCDGETDCDKQWDRWNDRRSMPMWCIPILYVVAIPLSILLNKFVEEPMRKWLRPQKK